MDNLLCDESWLSSPITPEPLPNSRRNTHVVDHTAMMMAPAMDETTVEEAIVMDLKKESCFSNHGDKFLDFIVSKNLTDSRLDAVQWLIQTRSRLNLSYETVFSAANVFDRFVYMTSCNEWTNWMVELVAVTSLSIASKFNEVTTPMLQELQMEGLDHMFHHKTLVEMELIMLKALDWRVNSVTSYSFLQILMSKMGLEGDCMMMSRITNHLLDGLCDVKMLRYPPCVIAFSAMWNVLVETGTRGENLVKIMDLLEGHKENIVKCLEEMKLGKMDHHYWPRRNTFEVKSFVSMLQGGGNMMNDVYCGGDLTAMFQIMRTEGSDKKRDREEFQDQMRPAKRMTMVMSI